MTLALVWNVWLLRDGRRPVRGSAGADAGDDRASPPATSARASTRTRPSCSTGRSPGSARSSTSSGRRSGSLAGDAVPPVDPAPSRRSGRASRPRPRAPGATRDLASRRPAAGDAPNPPAERDPVPVQVVRQPLAQLEVALAGGPIAPGRRDLGDAAAGERRLDRQLERQLEAGGALDRRPCRGSGASRA